MAFTIALIFAALTAFASGHRYAVGVGSVPVVRGVGGPVIPVAGVDPLGRTYGQDMLFANRGEYDPRFGARAARGMFADRVSSLANTYRGQIQGILRGVGSRDGCGGCPEGYYCSYAQRLPSCVEGAGVGIVGRLSGNIGGGRACPVGVDVMYVKDDCDRTVTRSRRQRMMAVFTERGCQRFNLPLGCRHENIFKTLNQCRWACESGSVGALGGY